MKAALTVGKDAVLRNQSDLELRMNLTTCFVSLGKFYHL